MKLETLTTRGLSTALRQDLTVDFDALGPGLVAIVGDNGSGKTHLLELAGPAVLYREFPSYGDSFLEHVAPGVRDASAELIFTLGAQRYRALVQGDPQFGGGRGKTEAYLYVEDLDFDEVPATGEGWKALAGPLVKDFDAAIARLLPPRELFLASVFACQGGAGSFFAMPKAARKDLFAAMLGLEHLQTLAGMALEKERATLGELELAEQRLKQALERVARADELKARRDEIRERCARADGQVESSAAIVEDARITATAAREALLRAEGEQESLRAQRDLFRLRAEDARRNRSDAEGRLEGILKTLQAADQVRKAAAELEHEEKLCAKMEAHRKALQDRHAVAHVKAIELRHQHATTKEKVAALTGRRAALELVNVEIPMCSKCPLTADAQAAEEEWKALREQVPTQARDVAVLDQRVTELATELGITAVAGNESQNRIVQLRKWADRLPLIEDAERREAATRHELSAASNAVAVIELELTQLPALADLSASRAVVDTHAAALTAAEAQLERHRAAARELAGERARLIGAIAALEDDEAPMNDHRAAVAGNTRLAADWHLLAKALGRDGIQALEVDAAGPGVTAIANELLASCYGTRFQLALETTALKKDGGQKEVFDVRIIDSEAGRDATRGSGGEMVILDEALRLALAIYNAQRSGFECRTLYRDETAGALSPANADRYVAMLRKARELGGFHQCLFICHQPEIWEQADGRLFLAGGRVTTDQEEVAA